MDEHRSTQLVLELEVLILQWLRGGQPRDSGQILQDVSGAYSLPRDHETRADQRVASRAIELRMATIEAIWRLIGQGLVVPASREMMQTPGLMYGLSESRDSAYPAFIRLSARGAEEIDPEARPALHSPDLYVAPFGVLGSRVVRCLREAIDSHRNGQSIAAVILLGVASEAVWWDLAEQVEGRAADTRLTRILKSAEPPGATQVRKEVLRALERSPVQSWTGHPARWLDDQARIFATVRDAAVHGRDDPLPSDAATSGPMLQAAHPYFLALSSLRAALLDLDPSTTRGPDGH